MLLQIIAITWRGCYNGLVKSASSITAKLKERGYRLTPQRALVLEAIEHSRDHISAEEIYAKVVQRYPEVNISTIYRTLTLLERLGLVTQTDLGGGRVRFHPANRGHHHHLICEVCGKTVDLDEGALLALKKSLREEYGFAADLSHLAIFGRCAGCQSR